MKNIIILILILLPGFIVGILDYLKIIIISNAVELFIMISPIWIIGIIIFIKTNIWNRWKNKNITTENK